MTGIFRAAAGLLTGGKYHWRTIATGLIGFNLLNGPRARTDPAFQQLSMFNGMGGPGIPQPGAVTAGGFNPNAGTGRPF